MRGLAEFELVDRNLRHCFKCYSQATGRGEVREIGGVLIASAGTSTAVYNAALLADAPVANLVELDRRIMIAKVFFEARGLRWCFWLCEQMLAPELRPHVRSAFERRRLYLSSECPGMVADRLAPRRRPLPAIDCRRVGDQATRRDFCQITALSFQVPLEAAREVYESERLWETELIGYVGYLGGHPVGTAATITVEGAIGVYSVATLPEHRGHGIGEALVRHAVERAGAATGIERSVLQASRDGESLYIRLGYRPVARFAIFVSD